MYSVYAFARTADNIADSKYLKPQDKIEKLEEMGEMVSEFDEARVKNDMHFRNIFTALTDTISALSLSKQDFYDLLRAFRQDAVKSSYERFEDILEYSKYSANPVGRLVLQIFGYERERYGELYKMSDDICTALQLANFWQDVSRDMRMNRVYIPEDLMKKYNYTKDQLFESVENDNFKRLMSHLADETEALFKSGKALPSHLKGRLKYELRAIINGGMSVLKMIRKEKYKVLSRRVKIKPARKLLILIKSLFYV